MKEPLFDISAITERFESSADTLFLADSVSGARWNYAEFYEQASRCARYLQENGLRRGDRVIALMLNSPEFVTLYFGCLFLGVVIAPVNPALHPDEIRFIFDHSGASGVVFTAETERFIPELAAGFKKIAYCAGSGMPLLAEPLKDARAKDLFSITFTSGTTSRPKAVAHSIGSLLGNARIFNQTMGFGPARRFLHVMPMSYMAGFLNTLLCPFVAGCTVILAPAFDAKTALMFWGPVRKFEADTFWMTPTMLAALVKLDRDASAPEYCRKKIRTICVGTAPLPFKLKKDFEDKYGTKLMESYGLSELLFVSANSAAGRAPDNSVGRLLAGVELKIVDEKGGDPGADKAGDILIRTPFRMAGYLDYKTLQPEVPSEWFASGDVGHLDPEGNLFITSRKKDLIIRGGLNISPRAVEDALVCHPAVTSAAVIGLPHDFYGEEVVAVLQLADGISLESVQASLVEKCREKLSAAAMPTRYIQLDEFPMNTNGKIQKNRLVERFRVGQV